MSNPSPTCEVRDGSGSYTATDNGVNCTPGNTVTIRLASQTDVDSWSIKCITTDETCNADTVDAEVAATIDSTAKTATFVAPIAGKAYRFRSRVNQGVDRNGIARSTYSTTFCVYTAINGRRVISADETTEGNTSFGWIVWHNDMIRSMPANGYTSVSSCTDAVNLGVAAHQPFSALRTFTATGTTAQPIFAWSIPSGTVSSVVVEANAVPSGNNGGGSYARRVMIRAPSGVATCGTLEASWTDEHTSSVFTGVGVGSGIWIGASGPTGFINVKVGATGMVKFGATITVQPTRWAS